MFSDVIQQKEEQIVSLCMNVYKQLEKKLRCCLILPNLATLELRHFSTEKYTPFAACAHEIVYSANRLAEKIEIQKKNDLVKSLTQTNTNLKS
jgi:F420-dependent methylenetetrahydromethanopterin dehydrogenase